MAADPFPATPGPARPTAPTGMLEQGGALGAGIWWCEQIFTVAGEWVPSAGEAAVRTHLAELSRVAGDHAVGLRRHLPRPTGVDPEAWVVAPTPSAAGVVLTLAGPSRSWARMAGLHRVLVPRLLVVWSAHERGAALADRGVVRTLSHAHRDLTGLWLDGEGILQSLIDDDPVRIGAASAAAAAVEGDLARSGGLLPTSAPTWPG